MRVVGVLLLAQFLACACLAQVYRWVDDQGTVHYSDTPPPGDTPDKVDLPQGPSKAERRKAQQDLESYLTRRQRKTAARHEATERERQEDEQQRQAADERQQQCINAQQQLYVLQLQLPVYREKEDGEREYADDALRASERALAEKTVLEYCD